MGAVAYVPFTQVRLGATGWFDDEDAHRTRWVMRKVGPRTIQTWSWENKHPLEDKSAWEVVLAHPELKYVFVATEDVLP